MEVPEPTEDLLAAAKDELRQRVLADCERLSGEPRALLEKIADQLSRPGVATLFPPGFSAAQLKRDARAGQGTLERLRAELEADLGGYFARCKIRAAKGLLRYRDLKVWVVASFVGYSGLQPFWHAFKTATGESPSEYRERSEPRRRKRLPATELHSDAFWYQATVGALAPEDHRALLARMRERCFGRHVLGRGRRHDDEIARRLWATLEPLPDAERRLRLRQLHVDSPAFFYWMAEQIRRRVRKDPQACLELAEQLLVHLEAHRHTLVAEDPNRWVLALAWRANARLLAVDLEGVEQGFAQAREAWRAAGEDRRVEAELCDLEASLRLCQRRHGDALKLLARSIALAQALDEPRILVCSLLHRVAILAPQGDHRAAIADLRLALRELEAIDEPGLTLVAHCNLASTYALAGMPARALEALPRARELCEAVGEPITRQQLRWTEGLARQDIGQDEDAVRLLRRAHAGLLELSARGYAAVVALDLGVLELKLGHRQEAARLAASAIPLFESLHLGSEAVAAVELLRTAILNGALVPSILRQARVQLLASLGGPVADLREARDG